MRRPLLTALTLVLIGCGESEVSEPNDAATGSGTGMSRVAMCDGECVLIDGPMALQGARFNPDSASPLRVAEVSVNGQRGGTVSISLTAGDAISEALHGGYLLVGIEGYGTRRVSFEERRAGPVMVHQFETGGKATIRYSMARNLRTRISGEVRLVQHVSQASIDAARTPFGSASLTTANIAHTGCFVSSPVTGTCNVTVTVSPYVQHSGGFFSDVGCCPASGPISVTFSVPVDTVVVTINDPTYAGNHMIGNSAQGALQVDFAFSGQPGNNIPDTQALIGIGIESVQLIPSTGIAQGDWVTWKLSFGGVGPKIVVTCTPNPVGRGESTSCTAEPEDPQTQTLTMSEWKFESSKLSGIISESSTSTTWAGQIGTNGTVRALGDINGRQASGKTTLDVTPRSWSTGADTAAFEHNNLGSGTLPILPVAWASLGQTIPRAGAHTPSGSYEQILDGPNKGVFYVTKVPVLGIVDVSVNYAALQVGSAFYNNQPTKRKNRGGNLRPICAQADVMPFLPKAEAHEGVNLEANSHAGIFRTTLNQQVPQMTEGVVALNDIAKLNENAQTAAQPGINTAIIRSRDAPPESNGTVPAISVTCEFKWFSTP